MTNPHDITRQFEAAIAAYTGAPYAVCVNSCTMALTLAVAWQIKNYAKIGGGIFQLGAVPKIEIPKRTYVSVPQAIIHAGGRPVFRDESWHGFYRLHPLTVFDSARWFTQGLYFCAEQHPAFFEKDGTGHPMVCVSFHASKTLGIEQGGAILHDNPEADAWFRRARFDGRTEGVAPKDDKFDMVAFHCYMNPSTAALGILKLHSLPRHNEPLPNDLYPDLSLIKAFQS